MQKQFRVWLRRQVYVLKGNNQLKASSSEDGTLFCLFEEITSALKKQEKPIEGISKQRLSELNTYLEDFLLIEKATRLDNSRFLRLAEIYVEQSMKEPLEKLLKYRKSPDTYYDKARYWVFMQTHNILQENGKSDVTHILASKLLAFVQDGLFYALVQGSNTKEREKLSEHYVELFKQQGLSNNPQTNYLYKLLVCKDYEAEIKELWEDFKNLRISLGEYRTDLWRTLYNVQMTKTGKDFSYENNAFCSQMLNFALEHNFISVMNEIECSLYYASVRCYVIGKMKQQVLLNDETSKKYFQKLQAWVKIKNSPLKMKDYTLAEIQLSLSFAWIKRVTDNYDNTFINLLGRTKWSMQEHSYFRYDVEARLLYFKMLYDKSDGLCLNQKTTKGFLKVVYPKYRELKKSNLPVPIYLKFELEMWGNLLETFKALLGKEDLSQLKTLIAKQDEFTAKLQGNAAYFDCAWYLQQFRFIKEWSENANPNKPS
ncbi:MAG: hypothetical protein ACKVTZ_15495 [Bacteroidia bacterium]